MAWQTPANALNIPVISGNVSLYNESADGPIDPTPAVGMVGLLEDLSARAGAGFADDGDRIVLLGAPDAELPASAIGGSEYLSRVHGTVAGSPAIDLDAEVTTQALVREAIGQGLVKSAHDVSDGGLAVAIAESCVIGGVGVSVDLELAGDARADAALFGEAPARIVVSVSDEDVADLRALSEERGTPMTVIGTVGGDFLRIAGLVDVPLSDAARAWVGGLLR